MTHIYITWEELLMAGIITLLLVVSFVYFVQKLK